MTVNAAELIQPRGGPPQPAGFFEWVHRGPAFEQGAIPSYLLAGTAEPIPAEDHFMDVERVVDRDLKLDCDVVIVGSGAGGAAAAAELSSAGLRVIVLEEGGYFTREDFSGPPLERVMRLYAQSGATQSFGKPTIPIPFGKTVGGTTTVNSGTCFRAPRRVLRQWTSKYGLEGIDYDSLDTFYREVESVVNVTPTPWDLLGPTGWATHYGAEALGLTGGPILRNISSCHGTGQCAFGCPTDAKQAMHLSYLPRAFRSGARIFQRTRADWVLLERGRASGVVATSLDDRGTKSGNLRITARAVVIACGSIGTPVFLLRNKIANGSGQLGKNLRIHPATGVAGWFDRPIYGWRGTLQPYYIDTLFDSNDVLLEATNSVPSVGASIFPGYGLETKELITGYATLATLGLLVSDTSKGRVVNGPTGEPLIFYYPNRRDLRNLYEGLALAARVLLAAGATKVTAGIPGFDSIVDSRGVEELRQGNAGVRGLKLSAFHPMGTARMGRHPHSSVVDPWLESHDVPGMFVTDASVFPSCIGVNPQMTIMALAARTASKIAERLA